jgi:hypothetical protein
MLTPDELYTLYTNEPCIEDFETGKMVGAGSPYDLYRLSIFLKQLKFPCFEKAPYVTGLKNTGSGQLSLPFKYLQVLDPECFTEIQPSVIAGTAHAIRNAADVSRACSLFTIDTTTGKQIILSESSIGKWNSRGATEHMTFFGGNSIGDCLFVLGPNIVSTGLATYRGTGCGDLDCLPGWKYSTPGSSSSLGAGFSCGESDDPTVKECSPCKKCEKDENGNPIDINDPCCEAGTCEDRTNYCCGDPPGSREYFRYKNGLNFKYNQFGYSFFPDDPSNNDRTITHIGYLVRKLYGGYANLTECSDKLNSCPEDLFLKYIQTINGYNYKTNVDFETTYPVQRLKTISFIQDINDIKDLLFNGYGVVLLSNVGFNNKKNSKGLAYPDKIWYHSYAIVGCDDTKTEFTEAVFLLANSWGEWNSGGHPSWGPLPVGSFLVTETHLKAMLNLERIDKSGCRKKTNITGENEDGCISDNICSPWECGKYQKAMGYAFALSFTDGFPRQHLDFEHFIQKWQVKNNPTEFIFKDPTNVNNV